MLEQYLKADRIHLITQRVGFALWQLQELEGCSAIYLVLLTQVQRGMGEAAGGALVKTAQEKTFGATIKRMEKAGLLAPEVSAEFARLLEERNWLVHRSRSEGRGAVHDDGFMQQLLQRLDDLAEDATTLLKKIGTMIEGFAVEQGVSKAFIDREAQQMLKQWEQRDA